MKKKKIIPVGVLTLTCPECNGKRRFKLYDRYYKRDGEWKNSPKYEPCETCGGDGSLEYEALAFCPNCNDVYEEVYEDDTCIKCNSPVIIEKSE
jgi:DnaJ-class molecular chaperone